MHPATLCVAQDTAATALHVDCSSLVSADAAGASPSNAELGSALLQVGGIFLPPQAVSSLLRSSGCRVAHACITCMRPH